MKLLKTILFLLTVVTAFMSCQRELYFDGVSTGMLKKDAAGNCLPITTFGSFNIDSAFTNRNFIEVQVEVFRRGTYDIISDTVNGYFFHQTGAVETGTSIIHLNATGKPVASDNNNFIIKYGTSTCNFSIKVYGPQPAVYTLAGAPDVCTAVFADGNYIIGKALTGSNILRVKVIVTTPGNYTLTAATANGFSFSGIGVFTTTGLQDVILKGTGMPVKAGVSNVTVSNITSTCNFGLMVLSDTAGKAVFSFDGSPNNCINFTVNGNYYAGIVATTNNTVTMSVNVTKPGTYNIITNTANGITFSNAGSFINNGQHTVTLSATGIPVQSESTAFIPNTGTISCNFLLAVQPLPAPAVFTLNGAPNVCTQVAVNGFYIVAKPLDAANTAVVQVNVSSPGSYTLSTNTVNGISFFAAGVFTTAGLQNVLLRGKGTPLTTGTIVLTPGIGTSSCNFSVTVI